MIPKKNHWLLLELARAPAHYSENCGIKEKEPRLSYSNTQTEFQDNQVVDEGEFNFWKNGIPANKCIKNDRI